MAEWKHKLTMLLNDKSKQEEVSREKKDRRDFEQLAALAKIMGLYRYFYYSHSLEMNQTLLSFVWGSQLLLYIAAISMEKLLSSVRSRFQTTDVIWMINAR